MLQDSKIIRRLVSVLLCLLLCACATNKTPGETAPQPEQVVQAATATPMPSPSATMTAALSPTARPSDTCTATSQPSETPTETVTPSPTMVPSETPTPRLSATPMPSNTPIPSNTPAPARAQGKIVFESDLSDEIDVHSMNADGSNWQQLTTGGGFEPRWSSAAQKIVFMSAMHGNMDIYTMNLDGSDLVQLTTDPGRDVDPDWAPDGSKIVFSSDRQGGYDLYVMNADGSDQHSLTHTDQGDPIKARDMQPRWSPDGQRILYWLGRDHSNTGAVDRIDDDYQIWVMNADGSDPRCILESDNTRKYTSPVWHPDSNAFAYAYLDLEYDRKHDHGWRVYAMRIDGTQQRMLYDSGESDVPSAWSQDGRHLLIESWPKGHWEIFSLDVETGAVTALSRTQPGKSGHGNGNWVELGTKQVAGDWRSIPLSES